MARVLRERIGNRETCPVCDARDPQTGALRKINCVRASTVGEPLDLCSVREDLKVLWRMGGFDDVAVSGRRQRWPGLSYVVREAHHPQDLRRREQRSRARQDQRTLDLKRDTIYDPSKVKRNAEDPRLYVEKGFFLADVRSEVKGHSPPARRVLLC